MWYAVGESQVNLFSGWPHAHLKSTCRPSSISGGENDSTSYGRDFIFLFFGMLKEGKKIKIKVQNKGKGYREVFQRKDDLKELIRSSGIKGVLVVNICLRKTIICVNIIIFKI